MKGKEVNKEKPLGRGKAWYDFNHFEYGSNLAVRVRAKKNQDLEDATLPPSAMEELGLEEL